MISLFLSLSLTLISVLGLAVNGYIFVVVLITKQFANASNILLLHLGSVNILLGVLSLSFSVPGIKGIEWPTSGAACTLYGFFFTLFHPLALWTVCGLNCDRYYVIAAPLHYSHIVSSKKVIIGLAIGWTISLVLCIPPLFTVAPYSYIPGLGACAPDFSVGDGTVWYAAAFTALSLLLPATVIVCCNLKILMIARYHRHRIASAIYEVTLSAQVTITHQRNPFFVPTVTAPSSGGPRFKGRSAICSVFELVGSFLVLYVPYYVALLLEAAINSLDGSRTAALVQENTLSHFYNLVTALLACTLPVNGFLYGLRSKALRKTFQNYWRKKQTKNEVNHEIQARTPSTCGSRRPSLTPLGFFAKPVLQRRLSETLFDASKSLKSPHRTKIKRIASELTWPSSSANSLNLSPKEEGKTLKQTTSCNTLQVPEGGPVEEEACFKERYRREQSGAGLLLQKLFRLEQEKLSRKAVQHVSEGTPERNVLEKNGSAADAAIATLFCNGMVTMQSMGLGGGFLMTVYKKDEKRAYFLNAREKAPLNASKEIYQGDHMKPRNGPLAIGVPGELRGYWALHRKFGKLPWKDLTQPTVDLCHNGYVMSNHQYQSLFKKTLREDVNFNEWFKDANGAYKKPGSKVVPKKLCETLAAIAANGGDDLYNGTLAKLFIDDVKEAGGIITAEDMDQYQPQWMDPVSVKLLNSDTIYSAPPPGSGAILTLIMNILEGYNLTRSSTNGLNETVLTYHRIIEAFKYAYAKRTELGDTDFVDLKELLSNLTSKRYAENVRQKIVDNTTFHDPKHYGAVFYDKGDHGTAHISVIDQNGDAISVTSSVNLYFGAGMTSKRTGIVFNSVMDDFSFPYYENYFGLPGSPNNEMKPGKRPSSSMSPSVIVDKEGDAKMVLGASGGTQITTSVAWTIVRSLWFGENIKEAVDAPRIHHQLFPMQVSYEYGILQQVVDGLKALGHKMKRDLLSVVCALKRETGKIVANADHRKGGDVYGLT